MNVEKLYHSTRDDRMESDRIWDLSKMIVAPTEDLRRLRFTWESKEEYEEKRSKVWEAECRLSYNKEDYFGLRAELAGEEIYPLIRIFNSRIIPQGAIEATSKLVKAVYPKSSIYWNSEHDDSAEYCDEYHPPTEMCPSFLAFHCIGLLVNMYEHLDRIENNRPPYDGHGIWLLKEIEK